jgi:ribosome-interacting GTPase 1
VTKRKSTAELITKLNARIAELETTIREIRRASKSAKSIGIESAYIALDTILYETERVVGDSR